MKKPSKSNLSFNDHPQDNQPHTVVDLILRQFAYLGYGFAPEISKAYYKDLSRQILPAWFGGKPLGPYTFNPLDCSLQKLAEVRSPSITLEALMRIVRVLETVAVDVRPSGRQKSLEKDIELIANQVLEFVRVYRDTWRFIYTPAGVPKKGIVHVTIKYNSKKEGLVPLAEFTKADHYFGNKASLVGAITDAIKSHNVPKVKSSNCIAVSTFDGNFADQATAQSSMDAHGRQTRKDPEGLAPAKLPKLHYHILCKEELIPHIRYILATRLPKWRLDTGKAGHFEYAPLSLSTLMPMINMETGAKIKLFELERMEKARAKALRQLELWQQARFARDADEGVSEDIIEAKEQQATFKKDRKTSRSTASYVAAKVMPTFQPPSVIANLRIALGDLADEYMLRDRRKYIRLTPVKVTDKVELCPHWGITPEEKAKMLESAEARGKKPLIEALKWPDKYYGPNILGLPANYLEIWKSSRNETTKKRKVRSVKSEARTVKMKTNVRANLQKATSHG